MIFGLQRWWGRNKVSFTAMAIAVAPSLFVSTTVPDAFSAATDIAVSKSGAKQTPSKRLNMNKKKLKKYKKDFASHMHKLNKFKFLGDINVFLESIGC